MTTPQAAQPQLSQLQPFNHLCAPSVDSLQYVHVSLVLGNPELGAAPTHFSNTKQRGAITCLSLQAILCLGQPRGLVVTLTHCWLVVNFVSSRTWRALFGRCFALSVPGLSWCLRLFLAKSRTLHYPLLSFIPGQPIYPASKDPSEWWHNPLVHQQLLPVLYSRSKRKFSWYSTAHKNVSQHFQTNKPSFFRKLSQWRYHNIAFTDSDDLYPAGKGSLHFKEWQLSVLFARGSLNTLNSVLTQEQLSRATQAAPGTLTQHVLSSVEAELESPLHTRVSTSGALPASHSLPFQQSYTLTNSTNSPGNICYFLKLFLDKTGPGSWTYFRWKQENQNISQSLLMRRIQQCRSS